MHSPSNSTQIGAKDQRTEANPQKNSSKHQRSLLAAIDQHQAQIKQAQQRNQFYLRSLQLMQKLKSNIESQIACSILNEQNLHQRYIQNYQFFHSLKETIHEINIEIEENAKNILECSLEIRVLKMKYKGLFKTVSLRA